MKMNTKLKYLPIAAFAAVAIALAGCGGGGEKAPVATMMDGDGTAMPDPEPAACEGTEACLAVAKKALDDAKAEVAKLEADQSSTLKAVADAKADVVAAQKEFDDAQTAHDTYLAEQPPTYDMKNLSAAIGTAMGASPAADPEVVETIDGGKPPSMNEDYAKATWPVGALGGFTEAVYEDKKSGTSIVTYTNKMAAKAAKFSAYYMTPDSGTQEAAPTENPTGYTYVAWKGVSGIADTGVLSLAEDVTGAPISFPGGPDVSSVKTFVDDDTTMADEREIKGTFHGVPGTYACATDCTAEANAKGELITLSDDWTFTPDKNTGDMMVADVLDDADYLDFGYWVTTMDNPDGDTYAVGTFAQGMTETSSGAVSNLTGTLEEAISATYKGGAAGLYERSEYSGTGDGDLLAAGRFTATAELTANFGTGPHTAVDDQNRISGTISNFMANGAPIDATWRVVLTPIVISDPTPRLALPASSRRCSTTVK